MILAAALTNLVSDVFLLVTYVIIIDSVSSVNRFWHKKRKLEYAQTFPAEKGTDLTICP